jgi:dTDP-glucose 4,6-dehydratase
VLRRGEPGQVYYIGGDCERTNLSVVEEIVAVVDRLRPDLPHAPCSKLVTYVKDRRGHDRRYAIDASKIHGELDWEPRENFVTGLEKMVRWYLENPAWVDGVTTSKYRRERLGLGDE